MTTEQAKPEETPDLTPGVFGQFLAEHDIPSTRLPDSTGVETIEVTAANLETALKRLRNSAETRLDFLVTVSGVDAGDNIESIYHLWSYEHTKELVIKVRVPKTQLSADGLALVPTTATYWSAANWHERETYDLVGIRYVGHPYMRRILNPWDWEGYPLRHDYKQPVDALNDKNPVSFR